MTQKNMKCSHTAARRGTVRLIAVLCLLAGLACFLVWQRRPALPALPPNCVYAYRTTQGGGLALCDCYYHIAFANGTIVNIGSCIYDTGGWTSGSGFAPELDRFCDAESWTGRLTLLYDGGYLYAYDGQRLELIHAGWPPPVYHNTARLLEEARLGTMLVQLDRRIFDP